MSTHINRYDIIATKESRTDPRDPFYPNDIIRLFINVGSLGAKITSISVNKELDDGTLGYFVVVNEPNYDPSSTEHYWIEGKVGGASHWKLGNADHQYVTFQHGEIVGSVVKDGGKGGKSSTVKVKNDGSTKDYVINLLKL